MVPAEQIHGFDECLGIVAVEGPHSVLVQCCEVIHRLAACILRLETGSVNMSSMATSLTGSVGLESQSLISYPSTSPHSQS